MMEFGDILFNIKEEFQYLKEKYNNRYEKDSIKINHILDNIVLEFTTNLNVPIFILTSTLYQNNNTGIVEYGKFVIRPNSKYELEFRDMKYSFVIVNNDLFFVNLIDSIIDWVIEYIESRKLGVNLEAFNLEISKVLSDLDYPFIIKFTLGSGILDISDNFIEIGLSTDVIKKLPDIGLFSDDEYWKNKYIEKFINVLKECNRPYDIIKIKSDITNELGIYNRKSINRIIRKFVSRKINYVRVGIGYAETENSFAILSKIPIKEEDIEKYKVEDVIIVDNDRMTKQEKKENLNKILISFKLSPFDKKTNELLDISLKDYLAEIKLGSE